MNDDLTPLMATLTEPAPPASFKTNVMARIAREAERQSETAAAAASPARRRHESAVWLWTIAGGASCVMAATAYGWAVAGAVPDVMAPLIGHGTATLMPMDAPIALLVGLGLAAYLAGLFAPLRSATSRR